MFNGAFVLAGLVCGSLIAVAVSADAAKDPQEPCKFEKAIYKKVQGSYLLYLPQDYAGDSSKNWPLVMFLHGSGERGEDVNKVKLLGPPRMVADGKQFPFILVSPQCPEGSRWNEQTDMLSAMIDEVTAHYRVDRSRVYLTGLSLGGYGTWALATEHPERFAAIAPICGGGNPSRAALIKDIPTWVFHGDKDDVVAPGNAHEMIDAIKAAGGNPKLTIYPGVGHDSWTATYNNPEFWEWLLSQRRQ